jgi:hypothetical protein
VGFFPVRSSGIQYLSNCGSYLRLRREWLRGRLPPLPEALSDAFANNPTKQVPGASSLRRNGLTGLPERFRWVEPISTFSANARNE